MPKPTKSSVHRRGRGAAHSKRGRRDDRREDHVLIDERPDSAIDQLSSERGEGESSEEDGQYLRTFEVNSMKSFSDIQTQIEVPVAMWVSCLSPSYVLRRQTYARISTNAIHAVALERSLPVPG